MRQVLSTTGGSANLPFGSIDFTVGEPFVTTITPGSGFSVRTLTQGFQQPTNNTLQVNVVIHNSTCRFKHDGAASVVVLTATDTVFYTWAAPINSSSPNVDNLGPGNYIVTITDGTYTINDTIKISEDQVSCERELGFWHGITPNWDGANDSWIIEKILDYPANNVKIFNRWGNLVWQGDNYDNVNVVWFGQNQKGVPLPDATYFYVVDIGKDVYKGWVQVTH